MHMQVTYSFHNWCHLTNGGCIKHSFRNYDITELIYIPFNHLRHDQTLRRDWVPYMDEVIVRSCKRLPQMFDTGLESHPRHHFHLIDPIMGPDIQEMVSNPCRAPALLKEAYMVLKRQLRAANHQIQFTPWAMTCLAPPPSPNRMLRFALETCCSMEPFSNVGLKCNRSKV